jgi:hypothetical protein
MLRVGMIVWLSIGILFQLGILENRHVEGYIHKGDPVEKIEKIYPQEWLSYEGGTYFVLRGSATHFGVVTQCEAYKVQEGQISKIEKKETAPFSLKPLPTSNKETKEKLKGTWISPKGMKIIFTENKIQHAFFDTIYDEISYRVLSPNEMVLYKKIGDKTAVSALRMWVTEEELYLFQIDEKGIPIETSIEFYQKDGK